MRQFSRYIISFIFLLFLFQLSMALPFIIVPKAGTTLPTSVVVGTRAFAYYTVTNATNNPFTGHTEYVKYLPPNVTQITNDNTMCGSTFTLNPGASCTLGLTITGAVDQDDPDVHHHLFVCVYQPGETESTCAGTFYPLNVTVLPRAVSSITVTPANQTLAIPANAQYTAVANYNDNSNINVTHQATWNSSRPQVATVSSTGFVQSLSQGNTNIIATFGGQSGSTPLTVTRASLVSIAVTPVNATIPQLDTQQYVATGTFSDGRSRPISANWTSSLTNIATIDPSTGLATAKSTPGSTVITATDPLTSISGNTTLTVSGATLQSVTVTPVNPTVALGLRQQFTATANYSDGAPSKDVTLLSSWTSGTPSVATIGSSTGLANTVSQGTSTITATYQTVPGDTTLTVGAPTVSSIAISPLNASVGQGATVNYIATGTYTNGTTGTVTTDCNWTSSVPTVASIVSNTGVATASITNTGNTTITATYAALTPASTPLTVTASPLVSISITAPLSTLIPNETDQFTATGTYADGSTANITSLVTWATTNAGVVGIVSGGLATAVAVGTATITASAPNGSGGTITSNGFFLTVDPANVLAVIGGSYINGSNQEFPVTYTSSNNATSWITNLVSAGIYAESGTNLINGVSCAIGTGNCVSVGSVVNGSGQELPAGWINTSYGNGSWGSPFVGNVPSGGESVLNGVACQTSFCVGVGYFVNSTYTSNQPVVYINSNYTNSWSSAITPSTINGGGLSTDTLVSVAYSTASPNIFLTVGYGGTGLSSNIGPIAYYSLDSGASWTATVPNTSSYNYLGEFTWVTYNAKNNTFLAVGNLTDGTTGQNVPFSAVYSPVSQTWDSIQVLPVPSALYYASLTGASCVSLTTGSYCEAVGYQLTSSNVQRPIYYNSTNGGQTWAGPYSLDPSDDLPYSFYTAGVVCEDTTCITAGTPTYLVPNIPAQRIAGSYYSQTSGGSWGSLVTIPTVSGALAASTINGITAA